VRSEAAHRDWSASPPADRPLASARVSAARAFFKVLERHDVSRMRLAAMLGIDEKTVRQWLDGTKPIPLAALAAMPADMATDLADELLGSRSGSPTGARAVIAVSEALERTDIARASEGERRALVKVVADVQRRLGELLAQLMG
jgi:hypothetical protein